MTRRDLLRTAAIAFSASTDASSRTAIGKPGATTHAHRNASAKPDPANFEWSEATISTISDAFKSGKLTSVSLTRQYLDRIAALDKAGPELHAVIETNPDALAIAAALDEEHAKTGPRGPLHGIPILIKDNIDTHDRMMTTAGSLALLGSIPPRDATIVERLRAAGAVLLGKTNLSEWANFRSTSSTSGWSGRGGLTKNPYALDRNPSGSSSGSAVGVSANLSAVAIGTETDGSIVSPASLCGIVGIKPTVGLISRGGIIPISKSQDSAGPMTRTVRDAAILLGVLTGDDPRDPAAREARPGGRAAETPAPQDFTRFLDADGLRGARIGVARDMFMPRDKGAKVISDAIAAMRDHGAVLIDPIEMPTIADIGELEFDVMLYEFKAGLNDYLAALGPTAPVRTLADIIEFNEKNRDRELPFFGQDILRGAQAKGPLSDKQFIDALDECRRLSRAQGIDAVMDKHRLDAIIAPTGGPAAKTDLLYGNRHVGGSSTAAAVAGYPNITVPAGDVLGLPLGISFFGRAFSEPTLLKLAYGFEQATARRKPPKYLATVG